MTFNEALTLHNTHGGLITLSAISQAQKELSQAAHAVSVLRAISELGLVIGSAEFQENPISKMVVRYLINEKTQVSIDFEFAHANNKLYVYEEYESILDWGLKIEKIIGEIRPDFDAVASLDSNTHIGVDLTPAGLIDLQNFLLTPTIKIKMDKCMLENSVQSSSEHKLNPLDPITVIGSRASQFKI